MGLELAFRLLGGVLLAAAGAYLGSLDVLATTGVAELYRQVAGGVVGLAVGLATTPYFTIRPIAWLTERGRRVPAQELVAATLGLLIGLILSALLAIPLSVLPGLLGKTLPFVACIIFSYLGMTIAALRRDDLLGFLKGARSEVDGASRHSSGQVLLDTSAIIDGRIADIGQTGFLPGSLLVPRFVLAEIQHIADSPDALRRNRGRRGLDVLNRLRKEKDSGTTVRIYEAELDGAEGVDAKLVKLARQLRCPIVTNDFNLNRVAALQGVRVLNINELANAVKSVVLPGEELGVRIIQEGKELGQGVGYLDDGTMVVVEGGRRLINQDVEVVVTRVLQTAAGRMIFAHPRDPREIREPRDRDQREQ